MLRHPTVLMVCAIAIVTVLAQVALFSASMWSGASGADPVTPSVSDVGAQAALARCAGDCSPSLPAMLLVTVFGFAGVIYFLVVRVFGPLSEINASLARIACGDLSGTAPRPKEKSLLEAAQTLNDIAANFQEALLVTGTAAGNIRAGVERMEELSNKCSEDSLSKDIPNLLADLRQNVELLNMMVTSFRYFHTDFQGDRVVADDKGCQASEL